MSIFIGFVLAFLSIVAVIMALELLPRMTKHPGNWQEALSYNRYGNSISPVESIVARLEKALTAQLGQSASWSPAKTEGQGRNLRLLLSQKTAGVTAMELRIFLERTMNGGTHASWRYDCYIDFTESYFDVVCQTDEAIRACLAPPIAVPRHEAPTFAQVAQPRQTAPIQAPVAAQAGAQAAARERVQQPVAAQVAVGRPAAQQAHHPAPVPQQVQKQASAPQQAQRQAPAPQQGRGALHAPGSAGETPALHRPKVPEFAQVNTPSVHLGLFHKPNYEKCPKCSKKWERDFHFCIYCGHA